MKKTIIPILILICNYSFATNYYVRTGGNNSLSGLDSANAWADISKVNSSWGTIVAGDRLNFHKGDTFYGTITIGKSGTLGNLITLGAFGTGANPIITGFSTISGWTLASAGLYYATCTGSSQTNMVTIDGIQYGVGRYPDNTFLHYNGWSGTTKLWSTGMGSATNFTGANIAFQKNDFIFERDVITSQSNDTINYTPTSTAWNPTNNYGFFIENDLRCVTAYGEWYHNTSTNRLYVFFGTVDPNAHIVKAATVSAVVSANTYDYITLDNLNIQGAINNAVDLLGGNQNITIQNCTISFAGKYGVSNLNGAGGNLLNNTTVNRCNSAGLYYESSLANSVTNSTITNIGRILGQAYGVNGAGTAIQNQYNTNLTITGNTIRGAGYNGIYVSTSSTMVIQNNLIDSTCILFDDGGAIYTSSASTTTRRLFDHNIITNVIGGRAGTATPTGATLSGGIYLDEYSSHVAVTYNSISNCGYFAVKIHKGSTDTVTNNTGFNNRTGLTFTDYVGNSIRSNTVNNNKWVAKLSTQYTLEVIAPVTNDQNLYGTINSNWYSRPILETNLVKINTPAYPATTKTLAQWVTLSTQDAGTAQSPKSVTNTTELKYDYNFSAVALKSSFTGLQYKDILGVIHNNADTIPAYSGRVLWLNGSVPSSNPLPVPIACNDTTITLPINSITLYGSASDANGILSHTWRKISGPSGGTITDPYSYNTSATAMVAGTYVYELEAVDSLNLAAYDSMAAIVVPAPVNIKPTIPALTPITITLPTSSTAVSASPTDADGTITSVRWSQTSGPATMIFVSPSANTSSVTGMSIAGSYGIRFRATDNSGDSAVVTSSVTVNPAIPPVNITPTIAPIANDTITLPVNIVHLVAVGHDVDGTIVSYKWRKISGPASSGTISLPDSAATDIISLLAGSYSYSVTVKDNSGDSAVSIVQITVNAAPVNQSPTCFAGFNQNIVQPATTCTLTGTASDPDGYITSYRWVFISGPVTPIILSPSSITTSVTGLNLVGDYNFMLTVTDNDTSAASASATIKVSVVSAQTTSIHGKKKYQ